MDKDVALVILVQRLHCFVLWLQTLLDVTTPACRILNTVETADRDSYGT